MKRLLFFGLLCLCFSSAAYAQKDKVTESSDKRKPDWIGRSDQSHFSVTEVGETLAATSDRCMASIRQYIINAVAVNISSAERMVTRQITRDQLISVMNDYSSSLTTEAGKLPYLNDITLSNAAGIYWERIYSKRTKTYRYEYSVLYPFSEQQRRQLIDTFVAIDDAKQAHYEQLRAELVTLVDLDRIPQVFNELDGLSDYFFDSTRKGEVETLRRNYLALYNTLSIELESHTSGMCVYSLRLGDRRVTTSRQPRLNSESAIDMAVNRYGSDGYVLTYNPDYASPVDINKIELTYTFGGARVGRTLLFDAPESKVSARPVGMLYLEQIDGSIRGRLSLSAKGELDVRQLELRNPADDARLVTTRTKILPADESKQTLEFEMSGTINPSANGVAIIHGSCTLYNAKSSKTEQIDFVLPYKLTAK